MAHGSDDHFDVPALSAELGGSAHLCRLFVDALDVSGASISVFGGGGRQSTICATDAVAARAETLQFDLGEGPHWEVLRTERPVLVPALRTEASPHWPIFGAAARELGIGALFAFPMTMGAVIVGVVDLYRSTPGPLDKNAVSLASSMARRIAGSAVLDGMASADHFSSDERESSPALRREVHQATGVILSQLDTTATDAFARLRAYSFFSGRPVADVARDVVAGRLDFAQLPD